EGTLLVLAVRLVSMALDPPTPDRSGSTILKVTLSGPVPQDAHIQITTDHPDLVHFSEWEQIIPMGGSVLQVPITLGAVAVRTDVTVAAAYAGVSVSTTIRLLPPSVSRLRL